MTDPASQHRAVTMPEKPSIDGLEDKWTRVWAEQGTYTFDRGAAMAGPRERVYSIDTPPPTASGSLHVGHVFSYTHTDCLARYKRMPASRSSTRWAGTTTACPPSAACRTTTACACEPSQPYDPEFVPPRGRKTRAPKLGRCRSAVATSSSSASELTAEDEKAFEALFRRLGLSVDWDSRLPDHRQQLPCRLPAGVPAQPRPRRGLPGRGAHTVGRHLPHRGGPGRARGPRASPVPTTASPSPTPTGPAVHIETTRPELLPPAWRWSRTPTTSGIRSTVRHDRHLAVVRRRGAGRAHHLAEPDKGSGIAMICTFGDRPTCTWWRELQPADPADHRLRRPDPARRRRTGSPTRPGRAAFASWPARRCSPPRSAMVELLCASGRAGGRAAPITHPVKFYEKGDRPLEIVTSRQWYIRNGGRDADLRGCPHRTRRRRSSGTRRVHAHALRELGRRPQR